MGYITYLFPNFNGAVVEIWEWISNFTLYILYCARDYLSMGLELIFQETCSIASSDF